MSKRFMHPDTYKFMLELTRFIAAFHAGELHYPEDVAVELDKLAATAWSQVRCESYSSAVLLAREVVGDSSTQQ